VTQRRLDRTGMRGLIAVGILLLLALGHAIGHTGELVVLALLATGIYKLVRGTSNERVGWGLVVGVLAIGLSLGAWQHYVIDGALWGAPPPPQTSQPTDDDCEQRREIVNDWYRDSEHQTVTVDCDHPLNNP
jgi:hypothetical protein